MGKNLQLDHSKTVVVCPTNGLPAEVKLDNNLRIESCSRRSEPEDCAETCALQVKFFPYSAQDFAAMHCGERCIGCGAILTKEDWYNNRLGAFQRTEGLQAPEKVALAVSSASEIKKSPLCSACYSASHIVSD